MSDPGRWTAEDHKRAEELSEMAKLIRAEVEAQYRQQWRVEWTAPFRWLSSIFRRR